MDVKEFWKILYIELFKEEGEIIKNMFNFPMSQIENIEEGFQVLKEHVRNNGK